MQSTFSKLGVKVQQHCKVITLQMIQNVIHSKIFKTTFKI